MRFERTGRFPGVVWLAPEPAEPFIALTELLAAAFPDHPPYEGAHDEIVPHLTLGLGTESVLGRLARSVRALSAVPGARPRDRGDRRERDGSLAPPLADPVGARGAGALDGAARVAADRQTVISSRCSPHATRRRSLISPTVARARTASMIARDQVAVTGRGGLERVERRPPRGLVPLGADPPEPLDLATLPLRVDALESAASRSPRRGTG